MAVPGLDGRDVAFSSRQSTDFHLACPVFLRIARADLLPDPFSFGDIFEEEDAFVGRSKNLFLPILVPIDGPYVMSNVQIVANHLALPGFFERVCRAAED